MKLKEGIKLKDGFSLKKEEEIKPVQKKQYPKQMTMMAKAMGNKFVA